MRLKNSLIFLFLIFLPLKALGLEAAFRAENAGIELMAGEVKNGRLTLGVKVAMDEGWHIYWRDPGEAGMPTALDWSGSENFTSAETFWPPPERFSEYGILTNGYKGEAVLPVKGKIPNHTLPSSLKLKFSAAICKEICVPLEASLALLIPPGFKSDSGAMEKISAAMAKVPGEGGEDFGIIDFRIAPEEKNLIVRGFSLDGFSHPEMFVETTAKLGRPTVEMRERNTIAVFKYPLKSAAGADFSFTLVDGGNSAFLKSSGQAADLPEQNPVPVKSFTAILLLAFLGGLILNVMPCVLPVLALKVLGVIKQGGSHRLHTRMNFMASALGILVSFACLAAATIALKSAGHNIGWGFQFQSPYFVGFLLAVVLLFSANLLGFFEIRLPFGLSSPRGEGIAASFLEGMLATLLATPCSAPFLGTAIAFALSGGGQDIFLIFVFMGLGLAFPFITLSVFPGFVKILPKPGAWMIGVKKLLGIALLATALWLGWVLSEQLTSSPSHQAAGIWQEFDEAKIPSLVAEGKTVFVDITADWCLTCKANKKLVLDTEEIKALLSSPNVVAMKGDMTRPKKELLNYIRKHNRYGIPFNAVYGPGSPQGEILPELLNSEVVRTGFKRAE